VILGQFRRLGILQRINNRKKVMDTKRHCDLKRGLPPGRARDQAGIRPGMMCLPGVVRPSASFFAGFTTFLLHRLARVFILTILMAQSERIIETEPNGIRH
jgi:hypothetical protein